MAKGAEMRLPVDPLCWAPRHPPWPPEECICYLLHQARFDERERIAAGLESWCVDDPALASEDPNNPWTYAAGVLYSAKRIRRGDFATARGDAP